ncbi:Fc receptor-like protein 3 isoform X2 [Electrophorus electricus]|uniref:Fc receptor-like protein 3 isoform X2 n=1 Tax=Electrophorus electricus TaxID=8005 RepID=UPI0015D0533F|nr:Fc receptor-like protein 3 isoform X2 [Electrophorus electricus]
MLAYKGVQVLIVLIHCGETQEIPKVVASINPNEPVFMGENVTLTCGIGKGEGVYNLQYHWKKEGSVTPVSNEMEYSISSVEQFHAGNYICEVKDSKGSTDSLASNAVSLTVFATPEATVTVWPGSPVFTGESVTLKCEVAGYNGWKYEWYKFKTITSSWTSVTPSENYTVKGYSLSIREDAVVDREAYRCRGVRYHRPSTTQYSTSATIITKALPRVTISVDPQSPVFTGESVTLKCEVKDYDGWTYQWYKRNNLNQWIVLLQSVHYTVNRDTITISRDAVVNGEQYRCQGKRHDRPSASQYNNVTLTVKAVKTKPELTSNLQGAALTGNPVTLYCKLKQSAGWRFYWSKHTQNPENETSTATSSYTISSMTPSDEVKYRCRAGRGNPVYYTHYSDVLLVKVTERPKPVVNIKPDKLIFERETVTLICNIQGGGDTSWTYSWYKDGYKFNLCSRSQQCKIRSITEANSGKYTCIGQRSDSQSTETSDALTLILSSAAQAVLSVFPQSWLTEGDTVTLTCEVRGSSTGWTFSWYSDNQKLLSNSSRGAGGSYTVSSAAINHTGVYMCRAERGEPAYQTQYSNQQPLWITGISPRVSLIISPSITQHFSGDSLLLRCEDHSGSTGWRVRRYTDIGRVSDCSSGWGSVTGSTCTISSLFTAHTGVYWCQSESGGSSNPVNITVQVSGESDSQAPPSMLRLLSILLPASLFLIVLIVLGVRCYSARTKPDVHTRSYTLREAETLA